MLKNIRFVILLATVILVTIVLSLRPDITSWLSTTKKIDKEAIVNDFAQEINTLLDNLPEKQIHFLDNTIYFKTLDSTRMFLGNESYNYENVKSHNSYKSFKETQNLSADDIFKRIIKNYNLNIEPNSNEISTPQDKKTETNNLSLILNANVKENRKTRSRWLRDWDLVGYYLPFGWIFLHLFRKFRNPPYGNRGLSKNEIAQKEGGFVWSITRENENGENGDR